MLDPLSAYIGDDTNMNLANECRNKFNYLIKVAKETNCAVVIIGHLNKAQGMKAINRTNVDNDEANDELLQEWDIRLKRYLKKIKG